MAEGTEVARAFVTIVPKSDGTSNSVINSIVGQFTKGGSDAGNKFSGAFGGAIGKVSKVLGALGLSVGITKFAKDSVAAGMEFDSAMSQVAATMGTTTDQITELRDFAKEMGASTAFSATQSAEALNYMALAGYDAETSMSMLPNVLNLAAAGGMELATASDMITDTQSALGLTIDETTQLVDKMAAAASTTNTSVAQLGDAMLTVGGTAKNLSGGTTEAAQALGILADNGIKGAQGGTALRNILLSISSSKFEDTFGELGISAYDAEGNMRSLKDVFGDMESAMANMTVEEKTKLLSESFNKVDLKSVNALLGTNAERWDEVAAAIDGSEGAAQQMADTQLDNLEGDVTIFKSALEGLQITFSDLLTPALRGFVQIGTAGLSGLTTVMSGVLSFFTSIKEGFASAFDSAGLSEALSGLKEALAGVFGEGGPRLDVASFAEAIGTAMANIVNHIVPVIEWITTNIVPVIQGVVATVTPIIQTAISTIGTVIRGVTPIIRAILSVFKTVFRGIVSTVTAAIGTVRSVINGISSVVKGVTSTFNKVRDAITKPIQKASELIKTAINTIKSIINGAKLELPHFKLPHFNISGGVLPWGIGGAGQKPSISVSWAAKGMILDKATLIGAGEAGREGVIPLEGGAMRPFAQAIANEMSGGTGDIVINLNYSADTDATKMVRDIAKGVERYRLAGAF